MSHVCVVGLGKIGLPLAAVIAAAGRTVVGLDTSSEVVDAVNHGRAPFPGEPGLDSRLEAVVADGSLQATSEPADAVGGADVVIIVVPLLVDQEKLPDFFALDAATAAVAPHLDPGVLVSYETTLPVGTTKHRFAPALSRASGLRIGVDLFVCHSPERVSSGRVFQDLRRYPKLVGGIDEPSEERAAAFYRDVLEFDDRPDLARPNGVWRLGSAEAAEPAKLAETSYRDLNIAFANELAIAAESLGIDVQEVIQACNSQPFSHIHRPGVWVGGHCIPVYPHLLLHSVPGLRLSSLGRSINDGMALHAVEAVSEKLGGLRGKTVAILGLAFRGGVKEDAVSGAYALAGALDDSGASVRVHDPMYDDDELRARGLTPHRLGDPCDAIIVQTDHPEYRELGSHDAGGASVIYDGRWVLDERRLEGVEIMRVGRPGTSA